MRLINNVPINKLNSLGLSRPIWVLAKNFLYFGERLKVSEQQLNFLNRCKTNKIFPVFISNNIKINQSILFPINNSSYINQCHLKLKSISLNQHIKCKFQDISQHKRDIQMCKDNLYNQCNQGIFQSIMCIFSCNNDHIKVWQKQRQVNRYNWVVHKYYSEPESSSNSTSDIIIEPDHDRITTVNCDTISSDELSVLALGPNFAVTPKIDDKFMDKIKVDVADCAFKVRHILNNVVDNSNENRPESTYSQTKRAGGFQTAFTHSPNPCNYRIEEALSQLNRHVLDLAARNQYKSNLSQSQKTGLRSLKSRDDLHISQSDKCGEFVIATKDTHKQLTTDHLEQNSIYRYIAPTKKVRGVSTAINEPTKQQYIQQIKHKTTQLEAEANKLWKDASKKHDFDYKHTLLVNTTNSVLPCMYTTIKTHKNSPDSFRQHIPLDQLKVRPIISCCNSPTENLAKLVTSIISPLLSTIPCHLSNLQQHLSLLQSLSGEQLTGLSFFSADVSALYTNINVNSCVDDVIELATEHLDSLNLLGLNLTEVHEILLFVLGNSFFTFDGKLYQQLDGLFMGMPPSPTCAIIRMYHFERNSIYVDIHYLPILYGRYIDDGASVATDSQSAIQFVNSIAEQDPENKIKWEVDFPAVSSEYTPFLNTEIAITEQGDVHSRLYRKPQKKSITLHAQSHHPLSVKVNTIRQSYKEAHVISSGPQQLEHSLDLVDDLYRKNGYSNPRQHHNTNNRRGTSKNESTQKALLQLDFISDYVSNQIRNYIKQSKLPIKVVFSPGSKLKSQLCKSRPYDIRACSYRNCSICPLIKTPKMDCSKKNVVYKVTCNLCSRPSIYIGECYRTAHERLGEHLRYAKYPNTPSNRDKSLAIHYRENHSGLEPNLSFEILKIEPKTHRRKIYEAMLIRQFVPELNDRDELQNIERFLITDT